MSIKYIYKDKKTGKKVYSNEPLNLNDYVLITSYADTKMKSAEITKK